MPRPVSRGISGIGPGTCCAGVDEPERAARNPGRVGGRSGAHITRQDEPSRLETVLRWHGT
jgi:hypothetical protein